jgi:glycosyltransferase involved in cell wall biosynthesis
MTHNTEKIAFLITTFERDELLYKNVESLLPFLQPNWKIIVVDQGKSSIKKERWVSKTQYDYVDRFHYLYTTYNCGLSKARNILVELANSLECKYCVLSADSIKFNDSILDLKFLIGQMNKNEYSLIGLDLLNRVPWEGWLNLIEGQSFELDFLDETVKKRQLFTECSCVRNFFVATTISLMSTKWSEDLLMAEHECFMYRYSKENKMACTTFINGEYIGNQNNELYKEIRKNNFEQGIHTLLQKYNIKRWITYKNKNRWDNG